MFICKIQLGIKQTGSYGIGMSNLDGSKAQGDAGCLRTSHSYEVFILHVSHSDACMATFSTKMKKKVPRFGTFLEY